MLIQVKNNLLLFSLLTLSALLSCAPSMRIDAVDPASGSVQQAVTLSIQGEALAQVSKAELRGPSLRFSLQISARDPDGKKLQVLVPAGIAAGMYDLHLNSEQGDSAIKSAGYMAIDASVQISVLDVGQGSALLAVGSDGTTILVDGGKPGRDTTVLRPALQRYSDGRLDAIVSTHFDSDHIGGVVGLLRGADGLVGTDDDPLLPLGLWDNGELDHCDSQTCADYREAARGRAQTIPLGKTFALGEAQARCVIVDGQVEGGFFQTPEDSNATSAGLLFSLGGRDLLVSGDLPGGGLNSQDFETPLAQSLGTVDFWVLNHHGSAASSNQTALNLHHPRAAMIAVGEDNAYCHPATAVLQRLEAMAIPTFLTEGGMSHSDENCQATQLGPLMQVVGDVVIDINASGEAQVAGEDF